jgi:hypothetical protein
MTLRASKPAFNVREKLTELGRRFGLKGSELAAAETVQDARNIISAGRKNLIINGGLQIWQRGSSITGSYSNRPYTADMFRIYNVISGSGGTFSQSTDVPSNEFTYSFKRDTTGYNGHSEINIPIELNRTGFESPFVPGETYTFSYWVKGDGSDTSWINNATGRWSSSVSSGTYVSDRLVKGYSGSGNWEKVIHEFTIDSAVPGTATYFSILIGRNMSHVGVNYWTGFQLERGRNATEFEHRSYGEELQLCKRYFQKFDSGRFRGINAYPNVSLSSGDQLPTFLFPVQFRTTPTMSPSTATAAYDKWNATGSLTKELRYTASSGHVQFQYNSTDGGGQGNITNDYFRMRIDDNLQFSAEL